MKVSIVELETEMGELIDLALWRNTTTGEHLQTIAVPRELLLRLYVAWACARLKEVDPSQPEG